MNDNHDFYVDCTRIKDISMVWYLANELCFSDGDIYKSKIDKAHPKVRDVALEWYEDGTTSIEYLLAPSDRVRRRMEVKGYTGARIIKLWERQFSEHITTLENQSTTGDIELKKEIELQKGLTFESWLSHMEKYKPNDLLNRSSRYGFNFDDMFVNLALTLEIFKPEVVWTELDSSSADFDPNLLLHANISMEQRGLDINLDFIEPIGNVLILTEGKSDANILSSAIKVMYPEYADMFEFVDFKEFKIEGGASMVTKMSKAFAGVRMTQRVIALFDNDAAGVSEKKLLDNLTGLPKSIKSMTLPDVGIGNSYPTIGPEGKRDMNINGSACSIEMYLGKECLTDNLGNLIPIRWTNWNPHVSRYQGALEYKDDASKKFLDVMKVGGVPKDLRIKYPEMNQLLEAIFKAFH